MHLDDLNGAPRFRPEHGLWGLIVLAATCFVWYAANELVTFRVEQGRWPSSYWLVVTAGLVLCAGGAWAHTLAWRQHKLYRDRLHQVRRELFQRRDDLKVEERDHLLRAEKVLVWLVAQSAEDLVLPALSFLVGSGCLAYAGVAYGLYRARDAALAIRA